MERIVSELNSLLIYNTPNSAEMNPVERIFGVWKTRSQEEILNSRNFDQFFSAISRQFYLICHSLVSRTIDGVQRTVWDDVYAGKDIYCFVYLV